jgi:hypothetical protein
MDQAKSVSGRRERGTRREITIGMERGVETNATKLAKFKLLKCDYDWAPPRHALDVVPLVPTVCHITIRAQMSNHTHHIRNTR